MKQKEEPLTLEVIVIYLLSAILIICPLLTLTGITIIESQPVTIFDTSSVIAFALGAFVYFAMAYITWYMKYWSIVNPIISIIFTVVGFFFGVAFINVVVSNIFQSI